MPLPRRFFLLPFIQLFVLSALPLSSVSAEDSFDKDLLSLIENSKKVKSYRLSGKADDGTKADDAIAGFKISAKGDKQGKEFARKISALLRNGKEFKLLTSEPSGFDAVAGFRIYNGDDTVDIALSGASMHLHSGTYREFASFSSSAREEWQKLLDIAFTDERVSLPVAEAKPEVSSNASSGSDAMRTFFGEKVTKALADVVSGESYRVKLEMPHMATQKTKTKPSTADGINPSQPKTVTHRIQITDKYSIIRAGKELDKQAVASWVAALSDESGYKLEKEAPDFGPEVAFKLLNGEEVVCVEIGFLSNRVRLGQKFGSGKAARIKPELRAKLFKLVKEAFPEEKDIQRLPATWAWGIQVLDPDDNDADVPDHSDM